MSVFAASFDFFSRSSFRRGTRAAAILSILLMSTSTAFVSFSGCASTAKAKLPEVVGEDPTAAELQKAVSANGAKIKSLYSTNATVAVEGQPGWANCRLAFQRPGNLRLVASANLVGRVVDCGCNDESFWYWNHFENPDELYYCRLDQFQNSAVAGALPIDPTWFPEAFGIVEFDESEIIDGPTPQNDGTILVTVKKTRPDGEYRKRIYLEPLTAAIKRQDVQGPNGNTIVSVKCREFQRDETVGVTLPKTIQIDCPNADGTLTVSLGTPIINDESKIDANSFRQPTDIKATAIDLGAKKLDATSTASSTPTSPAPAANGTGDSSSVSPAIAPSVESSSPTNSAQSADATSSAATQQGTGRAIDASVGGIPISQTEYGATLDGNDAGVAASDANADVAPASTAFASVQPAVDSPRFVAPTVETASTVEIGRTNATAQIPLNDPGTASSAFETAPTANAFGDSFETGDEPFPNLDAPTTVPSAQTTQSAPVAPGSVSVPLQANASASSGPYVVPPTDAQTSRGTANLSSTDDLLIESPTDANGATPDVVAAPPASLDPFPTF